MLFRKSNKYNAFVVLLTLTASLSQASTVTIPNNFQANTPAVAAQVNANFNAVKTSVDDNDSNISSNEVDIASLLATVAQLQLDLTTATNQITALNTTIATHNTRITSIEGNTVLELDGFLMLSSMNGYDTAEFTDINVQINDGSGDTDGVVNGLGNLIIGYNKSRVSSPEFCSDPVYDNSSDCTNNGEIWERNVRRGSHNLVLGRANSYDDFGGIVAGFENIINYSYASVLGGRFNTASGNYSSVLGGVENTTSGPYSSVSGGRNNDALGDFSSVSGGRNNDAQGYGSSISGGFNRDTPSGGAGSVAEYDWHAGTLTENF